MIRKGFDLKIEQYRFELKAIPGPFNQMLNELQKNYLFHLVAGESIQNINEIYIKNGWLINFIELYNLMLLLYKENLIQNSHINEYLKLQLQNNEPANKLKINIYSLLKKTNSNQEINLINYPFFRSLPPPIVKKFESLSQIIKVKSGTIITQENELDRHLFVLTQGVLSVYKQINKQNRQFISQLSPNSVFGEVGFLLNKPRTATIVAQQDSELILIKFDKIFFENLIQTEIAHRLKYRFWLIHALNQNPLFTDLPDDNFDQILQLCKVKVFNENEFVFKENELGNSCYIIIQGQVLVTQNNKKINILKQGDTFGEIALILNSGIRTASIQTQRETLLMEITQVDFFKLLAQNIFLATQIQKLAIQRVKKDQIRKLS